MGWTFVHQGPECAMDAPRERYSQSLVTLNLLRRCLLLALILVSRSSIAETAMPPAQNRSLPTTSCSSIASGGVRQQVVHHALVFDGQVRSYSVYLPSELSKGGKGVQVGGQNPPMEMGDREDGEGCEKRFPLVMVFHGVMMNAETMAEMTDLHQLGFRNGFIVVYLDGDGHGRFRTWNSGGRSGRLERVAKDDVGFVRVVLRGLEESYPIDWNRVHATGFSNGGMMCYRLAVEMPEVIASIAPVAGTLAVPIRRDGSIAVGGQGKRVVPSLHIHGTDDKFVPWGGPNSRTPKNLDFCSVPQTVQAWVRHHAEFYGTDFVCESASMPDRCADGTRVDAQIYRQVRRTAEGVGQEGASEPVHSQHDHSQQDQQGLVAIELVRVHGGGHTWPGGKNREWLVGTISQEFSANERMWEFFERNPKR